MVSSFESVVGRMVCGWCGVRTLDMLRDLSPRVQLFRHLYKYLRIHESRAPYLCRTKEKLRDFKPSNGKAISLNISQFLYKDYVVGL
jgi:hypothetical protein